MDWRKLLEQAQKLEGEELRRHAHVSRRNHHSCTSCFPCACDHVRSWRLGILAFSSPPVCHTAWSELDWLYHAPRNHYG